MILDNELLGFPGQIREIFPELTESEDERIRKALIEGVRQIRCKNGITQEQMVAYLEKQKDASKAIEAVERVDKYIDEHLANAHDMKDSNPDKKYYRGWDDALGEMARILQDVYSGERQKEFLHIPETCKENADSFTDIKDRNIRGCIGMALADVSESRFKIYGVTLKECLAYLEKQKETGIRWFKSDDVKNPDKPYIDKAGMFYTTDGRMCYASEIEKQKEEEGYEAIPVESTLEYKLGFKAGKESEKQKEQKDYNKLYEDIGKSEWFKKAYTGKSLGGDDEQKEQNPVKPSDDELQRYQDELHDFKVFVTKQAKEHDISISFVHDFEWNNFCAELLFHFNEQKPPEWGEEDEKTISDACCWLAEYAGYLMDKNYGKASMLMGLTNKLKSLRPQPKQELSKEDEKFVHGLIRGLTAMRDIFGRTTFSSDNLDITETINWLKSIRPSWKPSEEQMKQLHYALTPGSAFDCDILNELYRQLRKLM